MTREIATRTRRDLASWQRAALGLLALSVGVNTALCAAITRQERQIEDLETRYHAVRAIEADAVAAYGELAARVDADREARQAQAEAYEAIGAYEYIGECTVTYYCCEPYAHVCGDGDGLTATGLPVTPGVVAVDPEVIPLGSTVIIDGQAYLAADTGGAVRGNHVDIAVATHQEAEALGTTTAEVWVVADPAEGR